MLVVESAGITDVGRKRKGNEDAFFLDDLQRLYVVADGMGGHRAGEVASGMVIETLQDYMQRRQGHDTDTEVEGDASLSKAANTLLSGIQLANQAVFEIAAAKEGLQGMGTTVSAIYLCADTIIAANVGDSPIYLIQNDTIELISVPHTVMAEQQALDPASARQLGNEFKHMLTRAVGISATVQVDITELQAFKGDTLVISSDGLSDKVAPEEIMPIVTAKRPEAACRTLVDLANERGGDDNITVIILKIANKKAPGGRFNNFWGWLFKHLTK